MSTPYPDPSPAALCVAPNGARKTSRDHPDLPTTPAGLARVAAACREQGATLLHLHVRDDEGRHSLDAQRYRAAIAAVEQSAGPGLLIQVTTEAVGLYTPAEQLAVVRELVPMAASMALREVLPDASHLPAVTGFLDWARREAVALQFIVYTPDEAQQLVTLAREGLLSTDQPHALFVLGRYTAGQRSDPRALLPFLAAWPADWPWSVCAFGPAEARCMAAAIGLGGHARVGFENNHQRADGEPVASNAELVANAALLARHAGRPVATTEQARLVYGITRERSGTR